jgi:DnaJ-class molecular chaperone
MNAPSEEKVPCPSCGGAGGGPFGRAGSAWDDEEYMCPRCEGTGVIAWDDVAIRPGLAKAQVQAALDEAKKKTG